MHIAASLLIHDEVVATSHSDTTDIVIIATPSQVHVYRSLSLDSVCSIPIDGAKVFLWHPTERLCAVGCRDGSVHVIRVEPAQKVFTRTFLFESGDGIEAFEWSGWDGETSTEPHPNNHVQHQCSALPLLVPPANASPYTVSGTSPQTSAPLALLHQLQMTRHPQLWVHTKKGNAIPLFHDVAGLNVLLVSIDIVIHNAAAMITCITKPTPTDAYPAEEQITTLGLDHVSRACRHALAASGCLRGVDLPAAVSLDDLDGDLGHLMALAEVLCCLIGHASVTPGQGANVISAPYLEMTSVLEKLQGATGAILPPQRTSTWRAKSSEEACSVDSAGKLVGADGAVELPDYVGDGVTTLGFSESRGLCCVSNAVPSQRVTRLYTVDCSPDDDDEEE
eukprot:PhM_4_TR10329/c0_g1_i1/m.20035